jgi:hypothetical protein
MVEPDLPDCLTLWRCIGCGSMGGADLCLGTCAFKKLMLVSAEDHAALLDYFLTLSERRKSLQGLARAIADATETEEAFAKAGEGVRQQARAQLHRAPEENDPPPAIAPDDRLETWRCASCGQVEALHECLGICIRRNGDYVRGEDHDALNTQIERLRDETRRLASLARQFGWARPRPGQGEVMRAALGQAARRLLTAA